VLTHPILDQLSQLGLSGMAQAFAELEASDETAALTHADWLGLLVDRELTHRRDKRLAARLRYARLRQQASIEDVDYRAPRGLDRALFHKLTNGEWIDAHDNLILCGPTGVGKSWLACALGHKACRDNRSVLYQRVPKLFLELALARGDGRYARILRSITGVQLLILDDWGLEPLDAGARRDLYEILEERYGRRSTVLISQIPVDKWHTFIGVHLRAHRRRRRHARRRLFSERQALVGAAAGERRQASRDAGAPQARALPRWVTVELTLVGTPYMEHSRNISR
jgi:DNA replication protein DnaC